MKLTFSLSLWLANGWPEVDDLRALAQLGAKVLVDGNWKPLNGFLDLFDREYRRRTFTVTVEADPAAIISALSRRSLPEKCSYHDGSGDVPVHKWPALSQLVAALDLIAPVMRDWPLKPGR